MQTKGLSFLGLLAFCFFVLSYSDVSVCYPILFHYCPTETHLFSSKRVVDLNGRGGWEELGVEGYKAVGYMPKSGTAGSCGGSVLAF